MNEKYFDRLLGIKTAGDQQGFHNQFHYHPYEPTPYTGLEILFKHYQFNKHDRLVDFGCGLGRLNFYSNYLFSITVSGVEMNVNFHYEAMENRKKYLKKHKNRAGEIEFFLCLAEEYPISQYENRFYFFNPFSVQIFIKVVNNILKSAETHRREVDLILYYPSADYIYFLESQTPFEMKLEVNLPEPNPNERFLVYRLGNSVHAL